MLHRPVESTLNAPVRVMHEVAAMSGTPIMKCLLKGIADKARMCRPARPPANDATSEDVDHEAAQHVVVDHGGFRGGVVRCDAMSRVRE